MSESLTSKERVRAALEHEMRDGYDAAVDRLNSDVRPSKEQAALQRGADAVRAMANQIAEIRADRDEWKHQHENLLAMYQAQTAELAKLRSAEPPSELDAEDDQALGALEEYMQTSGTAGNWSRQVWELINRLRASQSSSAPKEWRCFHCDELCTDDRQSETKPAEPPTVSPRSEVAWLVEMQFDGKAHWWYGSDFTDDANQAVRFSRKQDADQVILERGLVDAVATDHMWCSGPSPDWKPAVTKSAVGEEPTSGTRAE